jgi:hypothetical protein
MVDGSASTGSGADSDPACQLLWGRKGLGIGSDPGEDLMGGFDADAGDFDQPRMAS